MNRPSTARAFRDPDTLTIGRDAVCNGEFTARRAEAEYGSARLLDALLALQAKTQRRAS